MAGDEVGQPRRVGVVELDLRAKQRLGHFLADRDQQPFEQRERLLLIFVDRLLLGEAAQMDHGAQRVERPEMLFPVMVERLNQNLLLDLDPAVRVGALGLGRHRLVGQRLQPIDDHFLLDRLFRQPRLDRRLQVEQIVDAFLQRRDIPLLGIGPRRTIGRDQPGDRLGPEILDHVADMVRIHDLGALLVNHLALVVHHIVEFDDLLANVVIARLDLFLSGLDRLGNHRADDRFAILQILVHQPREGRLRPEDAQQVIVEAEVESRQAGIALASRSTAQLVVDATAFVALGTEHEQPAGIEHALLFFGDLALDPLDRGLALGTLGHILQLVFHQKVDVSAQLDVGAAARHIGGNGHRAHPPGLRHDMRLALMEARVQDFVLYLFLRQIFAQHLRFFDADGADQYRLADILPLADFLGDRAELVGDILVEFVGLVDPQDIDVGRDRHHIHLVNVEEFGRFGQRGAGHPAKLGIHPEIILEGDRRQSLVLGLDPHPFLGLDRLVKSVRPAPTVHHPPGEFVDDDDLVVLDDIIDVLLEHLVRLERLIEVMHRLGVGDVIEVLPLDQPGFLEHPLGFLGAFLGQHDRLLLLVELVIGIGELLHDDIDPDIELGLVVGRAGDDQRRARFVDQDRIHLVDDRKIERPLDHLVAAIFHIVAQIVEAELVIGGVGDVAVIRLAAEVIDQIGDHHTDAHAEELVNLSHPVGVALGEIIVDRDDMHALAGQRIEIDRERRHQGLALAGPHLGDFAAVERDPADHLHVIMALAQRPFGRLAHRRKGFGQQIVELGTIGQPLAEQDGLAL